MEQKQKIIKEYTDGVGQLDEILNELTRDYCASECPRPPFGCCKGPSGNYSQWDISINEFFDMQKEEALKNGWDGNEEERKYNSEKICRYHTDDGCPLVLFKSPICIGHICIPLGKDLIESDVMNRAFIDSLEDVARGNKLSGNKNESRTLINKIKNAIYWGNEAVSRKKVREKDFAGKN
jgi:hypothetical protein